MQEKKQTKINAGKIFEQDFKKSFPTDVFIYRFKDSPANFDKKLKSKMVRFTASNICDFLAVGKKSTMLLELKSTGLISLPTSNLTRHQVVEMFEASKFENLQCYFIFNFRRQGKTYAIAARTVYDFYMSSERKSFTNEWCTQFGLPIEQTLLRKRYKYDVSVLLDGCS